MKRSITKFLSIMACMAVILIAAPVANMQSIQAAPKAQGTVDLKAKKLIIPKGKTQKIKNKTVTMVKARRYQVKAKFGTTIVKSQAKWKSSKPAVATVSTTGLITAKAPGTATIKVTYGKKSQTFKVKVIDTAAHKHSWKTLSKSTCATKGKKLCKTCGATGTTAMSKTHSFKITKKATCETKGVKTCTVCGTKEVIAKTPHKWHTETWEGIEGRGKSYHVLTVFCGACNADMTNWTREQEDAHKGNLYSDCFGANVYGGDGVERFPKYVMTKLVETYCEHCGTWKDKTKTDLYYVDAKGNKIGADEDPWEVNSYENCCKEHGFVLCEGCHLEVMPGKECPECHIVAPTTTSTTASAKKAAARKAVASPQDVITDVPDNNESFEVADIIVSDNATVSEDTVSEDTNSELNNNIPLD